MGAETLSTHLGVENALRFSTLRDYDSGAASPGEEGFILGVHDVDRVFWHILVGTLVIETVHLNVSLCVQCLQSGSDHIYLLINLDFLDCLIIRQKLLLHLHAVLDTDGILQFLTHLHHLGVSNIYEVLLDANKILDELLLGITLDMLNFLYFHLKKILLAKLVVLSLYEKVKDYLKNMRLQKRNYHQRTILIVEYSHHLIEIRMAHLDRLLLNVHCYCIKCSLVYRRIKLLLFILFFKISYVSHSIHKLEFLWLVFLHFLNHLLLIINRFHTESTDPKISHYLL